MEILSEEEIIKALNELSKMDNMSKDTTQVTFGIYYIKAIQGLLDLYNKEKEKNKVLERALIQNGGYKIKGGKSII